MAKFYGAIGFITGQSLVNDIATEVITEKFYKGDTFSAKKQTINTDFVNPGVRLNLRFSILADTYANQNILAIRYVVWLGEKWVVTSVEAQHPRLILDVGGLYNA